MERYVLHIGPLMILGHPIWSKFNNKKTCFHPFFFFLFCNHVHEDLSTVSTRYQNSYFLQTRPKCSPNLQLVVSLMNRSTGRICTCRAWVWSYWDDSFCINVSYMKINLHYLINTCFYYIDSTFFFTQNRYSVTLKWTIDWSFTYRPYHCPGRTGS